MLKKTRMHSWGGGFLFNHSFGQYLFKTEPSSVLATRDIRDKMSTKQIGYFKKPLGPSEMERGCKVDRCPEGRFEDVVRGQVCADPGRAHSGRGDGKPKGLRSQEKLLILVCEEKSRVSVAE